MKNTILVTGASGNVGGVVKKLLTQNNIPFFEATRNKQAVSENADLRWLDFYDPSSFNESTKGIETIFLIRPPAISDSKKYIKPFLEIAKVNGVKKIVFLSVIGADKMTFLPHAKIEKDIDEVGFDRVFLRPAFFMQNFSSQHRLEVQKDNQIFIPAGKSKINFIDVRDIAEVATHFLKEPKFENQALDLTGQKSFTMSEIAEVFSSKLNRKIVYKNTNWISFYGYRQKLGDSWIQILVMIMLYTLSRFGMSSKITDVVEKLLNKPPITFDQFVDDNIMLWK